jgi:hypothetical protein
MKEIMKEIFASIVFVLLLVFTYLSLIIISEI